MSLVLEWRWSLGSWAGGRKQIRDDPSGVVGRSFFLRGGHSSPEWFRGTDSGRK